MINFNQLLTDLLKKDSRFVDQDGDLLKSVVVDKAWKVDQSLVELLLENKEVREKFFDKIKDALVFNITRFVDFIQDKHFLSDSWTKYKNKVGLNIKDKFLKERGEVSLVWPYKDCVLEAGMTDEESSRKEIFFNEVLAQDEIDRLLDPKVLVNWKRYTKDGEKKVTELKRGEDGTIKENLIIKGNNLLALHSLKSQFAGKVKLIYIDPPYNTGNDGFRYNDNFNHSSWLTFMHNRLEVAKELLQEDGVIFVQCDNNEQAYLKVLMDEVFGGENFIEIITVVNNPRGRDYGGVANMHEIITVFGKSLNYRLYPLEDKDKEFPYEDSKGGFEVRELRNRNTKFNDKNRPNLVYPFYLNPNKKDENGFLEISLEKKDGLVEVWPAKSQGIQTVWRWGKEKSSKNLNVNICGKAMKEEGRYQIVEKYREKTRMARSVWWDKEVNSERGTLHLKQIFGEKVFNNPKPEETLKRIIEMSTKEGDIVLDYHLGSGTTSSTAHKMGRQHIGIEQMDYVSEVTVPRLQKVIKGERGGVSESVSWEGGGEFVYCELAKWNESFVERIRDAKDTAELLKIWEDMKNPRKSFLSYNVDLKQQDEAMEEFKGLSLEKQRKALIMLLDKNQLYVNLSEIDDKDFEINDEDKNNSNNFYNSQS